MRHLLSMLIFLVFFSFQAVGQSAKYQEYESLAHEANEALEKGIKFFRSISIDGGFVYHYTLDLTEKWGEGKTDDRTIEVQPPGTPAVGMSFLNAYLVTRNEDFLDAAHEAAQALIRGQNALGGWEHKIYFDRPKNNRVSFDDNQTQGAISFLMALDRELEDPQLTVAIDAALEMMVTSQLENGGWPHQYPANGSYHDFATFNDQGINDCIRVMIEADSQYDRQDVKRSLEKAGRFLIISQLPPPQPGWAQQYNEYLQPAWARSFEPPSVCPSASAHNIHSLLDLYAHTGNRIYLEPIPDARRWLRESQLPNGKWGRFLELGTNRALYYDRDRIRVNSLEELSLERRTGYGYETDISNLLESCQERFDSYRDFAGDDLSLLPAKSFFQHPHHQGITAIAAKVSEIIKNQDEKGRWVVYQDKFRAEGEIRKWDGQYRTEDRISSGLFNQNMAVLCQFLQLYSAPKP